MPSYILSFALLAVGVAIVYCLKVSIMKYRIWGLSVFEVLIVIAIIAIFGVVLFPFFGKIQEASRQAGCASNLREIGIASLQYTHDNDNHMPQAWMGQGGFGMTDPRPASTKYKWMDEIYPYVKDASVFHCPDDVGLDGAKGTYIPIGDLTTPDATHYGSYGMNSAYWHNGTNGAGNNVSLRGPGNNNGQSLSAIKSPSTVIWVGDGTGSFQIDWCFPGAVSANTVDGFSEVGRSNPSGPDGDGALCFRHGAPDLANVLFVDGHVRGISVPDATATAVEADGKTYNYMFINNGK
jgi:prepilin-type processing-associated H-X9-DG protein